MTVNGTNLSVGYEETSEDIGGAAVGIRFYVGIEGNADLAGTWMDRHTNTAAYGGHLLLARSRGTTHAGATVVQDNDYLGRVLAVGYDGTDYAFSSQIHFEVDDPTPAATDMGGAIVFSTCLAGTEALAEQMRIDNAGNLGLDQTSFGTNAVSVFAIGSGTAPTTSPADAVQMWCADRGATAGKAGLHVRSEDGTSHVFSDLSGIGTTAPESILHIYASDATVTPTATTYLMLESSGHTEMTIASGNTNQGVILFADDGANEIGRIIYDHNDDTLGLYTNNVVRLTLDVSGNMGLDQTSWGTNAVSVFAIGSGTAPTTSPADAVQMWCADREATAGTAGLHVRSEDGTSHILSDRVGFGTVVPYTLLNISSTAPVFEIWNTTEEDGDAGREGIIAFRGEQSGAEQSYLAQIRAQHDGAADDEKGDLIFYTNDGSDATSPTERMRIDSYGNVLIGTTSVTGIGSINVHVDAGTGATNSALLLEGDCDGAGTVVGFITGISKDSGETSGRLVQINMAQQGADADEGQLQVYCATSAASLTERFRVEGSGDTYTNDGTVSSLSDKRVKTNIAPLTDGLDVLLQLKPMTYEYADRSALAPSDNGRRRFGFVADDVEKVAPQYVGRTRGNLEDIEDVQLKTLSMGRMFPMAVKAIQELAARVNALERRVADLEARR